MKGSIAQIVVNPHQSRAGVLAVHRDRARLAGSGDRHRERSHSDASVDKRAPQKKARNFGETA